MVANVTESPVLVADQVTHRFGDRAALSNVSFHASPGELIAIIGPNGAGKTTLLSILAGSLSPSEGKLDLPAGNVGWVPQQPALYSKLSVRENLLLFAHLEKLDSPERAVEEMLEQTGLNERSGEQVGRLSGGNRQRINIAIGLLSDPAVLLLDEPSTALDPRQRERLWDFVGGRAEQGTAVIYSTHYVQEAERHADRVLVLAEGELLFSGTPTELERAVAVADLDFEGAFVRFLRDRGH